MKKTQDGKHNRSKNTNGTRSRRNQVIRACNWCRLNRVKCDDNQPCRNCEARGGECESNGRGELRSLPQATREIERLKSQIKSLETQLEEKLNVRDQRESPASNGEGLASDDSRLPDDKRDLGTTWDGPAVTSFSSVRRQLYGPSSPFHYIRRLSSFHGTYADDHQEGAEEARPDESDGIANVFSSLTIKSVDGRDLATIPMDSCCSAESLSYAQESYFLGLFWDSYFSNLPILDECEFNSHYKSLWNGVPHGQQRKPSPLVDIIMALCMQYAMTFIPRTSPSSETRAKLDCNDSSIAGRGFFRRCQSLLAYEMERPSVNTLQCHILSALYLRNASFITREHITIAVAARLAYLLGIHQKVPSHLPRKEQELRKRLFWCIYAAENKIGLNIGHPILVSPSLQSCGLPSTDAKTASEVWSNSAATENGITFLQYQVEYAKLVTAVRSIHMAFGEKCSSAEIEKSHKEACNDVQCFEDLAKFLSSHLQPLRDWVDQCPPGIRLPRRAGGRSFSTDRSPVEIDLLAPLWLQRQCILLELLYHNQTMCLYAPFLRFSQTPNASVTVGDRMALCCLQHAMTTINIIHQVLLETDILNGWHEAYKFTWDATTSILAFIFAYPVNPSTQSAWRALSTAIEIFDIFGNNFAIAARAATVAKDLATRAESFMECFRPKNAPSPDGPSNLPTPASSHRSLSSIGSGVEVMNKACTQPQASTTSYASLSGPAINHINQMMTGFDSRDEPLAIDMDTNIDALSLMDHDGLSGDDFGFQFPMTPFPEFNTTYDDGDGAAVSAWPDLAGALVDFGPRSFS